MLAIGVPLVVGAGMIVVDDGWIERTETETVVYEHECQLTAGVLNAREKRRVDCMVTYWIGDFGDRSSERCQDVVERTGKTLGSEPATLGVYAWLIQKD